jgi:hypothetical protein
VEAGDVGEIWRTILVFLVRGLFYKMGRGGIEVDFLIVGTRSNGSYRYFQIFRN